MIADLTLACQLSKASDVAYYVDHPGGMTACPFYQDVGFVEPPDVVMSGVINAAIIGRTQSSVVLAFRGTLTPETDDWHAFWDSALDWLNDAAAELVTVPYTPGLVHKGFSESVEGLWGGVMTSLKKLWKPGVPLYVTGHSKGGSLANLAAVRLVQAEKIPPTSVYTFAGARAGDTAFVKNYTLVLPSSWRFENTDDIVPHLPPSLAVLGLLSAVEPRLKTLTAHEYRSAGTLQFINWNTQLVGGSILLDAERLTSFLELLAKEQIEQIAQDHSIEKQYIPKIVKIAG